MINPEVECLKIEKEKKSEVQLHVYSPPTGLAINSATNTSAVSGALQYSYLTSAMDHHSYLSMIIIQMTLVLVLSVLPHASSQGMYCYHHDSYILDNVLCQ